MGSPTDDTGVARLVRRARNARLSVSEQQASFAELVGRFEAMAFATALRLCGNADAARDACQDGFLLAWRTLPALREPAAFGGWLKRIVATQCARCRRRELTRREAPEDAREPAPLATRADDPADILSRKEAQRLIRRAVAALPAGERDVITLFYFLGEPLRVIARVLGISAATAGKRAYSGRLRLRRLLPRSVAASFLAAAPAPAFTQRVQAGIFDEFAGVYRFLKRPDQPVTIRREGNLLVGYGGGQRNVLASTRADRLAPTEFDGEGRFRRDRQGRISHFVYYEFGKRLGVAHRVDDRGG